MVVVDVPARPRSMRVGGNIWRPETAVGTQAEATAGRERRPHACAQPHDGDQNLALSQWLRPGPGAPQALLQVRHCGGGHGEGMRTAAPSRRALGRSNLERGKGHTAASSGALRRHCTTADMENARQAKVSLASASGSRGGAGHRPPSTSAAARGHATRTTHGSHARRQRTCTMCAMARVARSTCTR